MAKGTGKSGQEIGEEHVQRLIAVLDRYRSDQTPLPRYYSELNRSRLANECGFDRQIFRTNPRCAALLEAAEAEDRCKHLSRLDQAELKREEKGKVDEDRADLEAQILKLMAENASLKIELERFR